MNFVPLQCSQEEAEIFADLRGSIAARSREIPFKVPPEKQKEILKRWKEYPSLRYVRKKAKTSNPTIKKVLDLNGIPY